MKRVGDAPPTWSIERERLEQGINIVDLLWETGEFRSRSEIRRLIEQGGIRIVK